MTARLRLQFLGPLSISIASLLAVWVTLLFVQHRATIDRDAALAQSMMERLYRDDIGRQARLLGAVMDALQQNAPLRAAFARRDRKALLELSTPLYAELRRKHGITHFYFSTPDQVNLLRVHQPDRYGDRIDRYTMKEAARTGHASHGMELGPLGTFTLREVSPWLDGPSLLGYVELGIELDQMLRNEEVFTGMPLFPLIAKNRLDRRNWEAGMKTFGHPANWPQFRDVVLSTQAVEGVDPGLSAALLRHFADGGPVPGQMLEFEHKQSVYRTVFISLQDAAGQPVGTLVTLVDIAPNLAASRSALIAGVLSGTLIAGFLLVFFNWLVGRLGRQLERDESELRRLAVRDSLTGLNNHGQFFVLLAQELDRGKRYGRPVSLLMLDVDEFKRLNDAHGHQAGDAVLVGLSRIVDANLRRSDSASRYGGEEFAVILPETELDAAAEIAERLRASIAAMDFATAGGTALRVTVSIGIASWPLQASNADTLVAAADAALYEAKRDGKNRIVREMCPAQDMP